MQVGGHKEVTGAHEPALAISGAAQSTFQLFAAVNLARLELTAGGVERLIAVQGATPWLYS
ncbi:hypothetical protein D3C85_1791560 [compost metagenome]